MNGNKTAEFEAYQYPVGRPDGPALWRDLAEIATKAPQEAAPLPEADLVALNRQGEKDREQAEADLKRRFEAERRRGFEEGRDAERQAHAAAQLAETERHKEQYGSLVLKFELERNRYLQEVEHEVVSLALAVAARILRREAQMDPLLLTGAVRVALGQLAKNTKVRLHVPASEIELWTEAITHIPNLVLRPVVTAGEGMRPGDCQLETEIGFVDLGIRSQLGEIERGFFDRSMRAGNDLGPSAEEPTAEGTRSTPQ